MSIFIKLWNRFGLQMKLQILIQGFLIIILLFVRYGLSNQFEQLVLGAAKERTVAFADGAINGLNTLMDTKLGNKDVISDLAARALFIEKMGISEKLLELRVVRGKGTDDEYGAGLVQERPVDDMDLRVLASGKTEFKFMQVGNEKSSLRAVLP